jgi:putative phosphoribosyl transferase
MHDDLNDFPESAEFVFRNRAEAGQRLGAELRSRHLVDPLVLGLPRGGVEVAYEIARALNAPLDVIPARKLGAPFQPEVAIGAIAPGAIVLNPQLIEQVGLRRADLDRVLAEEMREMSRQAELFRSGRPALDVADRTVVLADDGLATGATAAAAIQSVRQGRPRKLILAVPVGAADTVRRLHAEVDELVCLETPRDFQAVGQWYENFDQTTDVRVIHLLRWKAATRNPVVSV